MIQSAQPGRPVGLGHGREGRQAGARPAAIAMDDPRLLDHFDRELLRVVDGDDGEAPSVDGFAKYIDVRRRVREGNPLKT